METINGHHHTTMHTSRRIVPKIVIVTAAAGIIALAAILLTPSSVPAKPAISWTPGSVTQTILAGESATVPVSFTATENLTNVVVRVVPELAPYVQANPASFPSIAKGQTVNLDLTIFAPIDSLPKTVDGVIQLRSGAGAPKTFAKPLAVKLIVQGLPQLPPDPGEAGKSTLEGIDSDNDGVRDDIERYIALTYPNSERMRVALTQLAVTNQDFIINGNESIETLLNIVSRRHRAADCLDYVSGGPENALALLRDLRAQILNTKQRSRAYMNADRKLSGRFFPITDPATFKNSCDFDPDSSN